MSNLDKKLVLLLLICPLLPVVVVVGECTCDTESLDRDKTTALKYKLGAMASILVASAMGLCLPMLGKHVTALQPEKDVFYLIKAFAAGVILSTGFIHVLPDAFESLMSPCLNDNPWGNFPFAGFVAMVAGIGTLMIDTYVMSYYTRIHFNKAQAQAQPIDDDHVNVGHDLEVVGEHQGHVHVHTHATHGHSHGSDDSPSELLRRRVISQVLELGIVVHSVIIGIALGASESPNTIRPLLGALTFHQFFEGMGLGGCIAQAKFNSRAVLTMATFFSLTTPVGIAIGIGISSTYNENSTTALIVEGTLNAASAGILIYTALVDLLAQDLMSSKIQKNAKLLLLSYFFILFGAACMSVLAKWA